MASAFSTGEADFVTLFEPTATQIELAGKGHIVAAVGSDAGEIPYTAYFAKKSYIEKNIININEEETIENALEQMKKHKIKRLLVTNENKVTGILSLSDILQHDSSNILPFIQTIFENETNHRENTAEIDSFYL